MRYPGWRTEPGLCAATWSSRLHDVAPSFLWARAFPTESRDVVCIHVLGSQACNPRSVTPASQATKLKFQLPSYNPCFWGSDVPCCTAEMPEIPLNLLPGLPPGYRAQAESRRIEGRTCPAKKPQELESCKFQERVRARLPQRVAVDKALPLLIAWASRWAPEPAPSTNLAQQIASAHTQHEMSLGVVQVSKDMTLQDVMLNMKQMLEQFLRTCVPATLPDMLIV